MSLQEKAKYTQKLTDLLSPSFFMCVLIFYWSYTHSNAILNEVPFCWLMSLSCVFWNATDIHSCLSSWHKSVYFFILPTISSSRSFLIWKHHLRGTTQKVRVYVVMIKCWHQKLGWALNWLSEESWNDEASYNTHYHTNLNRVEHLWLQACLTFDVWPSDKLNSQHSQWSCLLCSTGSEIIQQNATMT